MKHPIRTLVALLALALAFVQAGCSPARFATPQEEARAQAWLAELRARHFDAITRAADPSVPAQDLQQALVRMADAIPAGAPSSVQLVGDFHMSSPAGTMANLTYEYDYGGHWLLANVAIKSAHGVDTIVGLNVTPIPRSVEEQNRFGLAGKPAICYVVLALALLMPLFTIFALVVCARTRLRGRKWPWIVFILFGFGSLSVNWTTGQCTFTPLMFLLFSAGAAAAPYGPWVVSAAVPVGALVFLVRRLTLMAPASAVPDAASAVPAATE
jgi:hypothetical protein